ncbi:adenosine deaminase-like protein [Xenia sp. Carnegie-2017]|uniref:adenosine deaminase-like protein n=1 Tax=Xenia sp. Carnegie-2017 TaxID=2897299 RepID=UPI001F03D827|nr:adenosine deaminase-like protein [Xenia sp. Carnegie-2017]
MVDRAYTKALPKVEVHAHLNGSISRNTIKKLIAYKKSRSPNGFVVPNEWECCISGDQKLTLDEGFMLFKIVHKLVDDTYSLAMVTRDVIYDFYNDGVRYLELRSTPRESEGNITKRLYVKTIVDTIAETMQEIDIIVRFLVSIDRRKEVKEAEEIVDLAVKFKEQSDCIVIGVDLSGDPKVSDVKCFLPCLSRARFSGLKLALHCAEIPCKEEVRTLLEFGPDRIGHGTCIYPDKGGHQDLVNLVLKQKIPIEVCLTSNVKTRTVKSYEDHHFKDWLKMNHPLIICTDDKGVFVSSLSEEYFIAGRTFGLSKMELWELSYKSIEHIFQPDVVKQKLQEKWKKWKEQNV